MKSQKRLDNTVLVLVTNLKGTENYNTLYLREKMSGLCESLKMHTFIYISFQNFDWCIHIIVNAKQFRKILIIK